ncbi:sigma 54-interacting transcriptional regulator [Clostridium ljungdahlii]|uniref:Nif-specific regulatory protein n=1 Tax=Clostridium ljungdahlii TaxID=1538 RepID=A0A162J7L8_9CLOT|nr:sigma-54-dependent transcriptional regulator [Clostridium ljungdahlii]OAA91475.1 Nif-specific regulatory protein [Clostridium ljungdahlii]
MKRIDRIYNYLLDNTAKLDLNAINEKRGFSASEISKELNMLRNNVSMELNLLLRNRKIIKIKGRPVLFLEKDTVENIIGYKLEDESLVFENIDELIKLSSKHEKDNDPFNDLIGAQTSLKNQIEQAKAAVLYPPNGLHTLIVGQTGVGKTLFANMMYNYAKYTKKFNSSAPFVVFNCADYYNNPQLLISQIFGHVKGAFTGADNEKSGLVQKADGGILFLDEIHRLPPEGQEMIFYFMDTGTYNKLGETERKRRSNVLIIGATTEDPESSLLKTFVRRIPIIITIPTFEERPIKDKLEMIKFLLSNEAHRVNKPIKIEDEAVKALVGSATFGNVGQMKSNIQLVCAKGFLNSIDSNKCIEIDFKSLPTDIKDGIFHLGAKRKEMEEISECIDSQLVITPDGGYKALIHEDPYEPPFNLYKIIEDKAAILKDEGADNEYIKNFITTDINVHIKCFYDKFKNDVKDREKILKIVNEDVLEFAEEIKDLVEVRLNKRFNERFLYALSLHLSAFFKRVENKRNLKYANVEGIIKDNPDEYNVSVEIKELVERKYEIVVPDMEVVYLTLLLSSVQDTQNNEHVALIVAAHGSSTASSMVNVAKQLLGDGGIEAIDMPLEVNPKKILDDVTEKVKEMDMGKGVLLLVDMGSLANFDVVITEKTGIKVKSIDMVSTPLVLEAVRKANIFDMDLDSIYDSLKEFRGYGRYIEYITSNEHKAIITICSSGQGAAEKLKDLVSDIIVNLTNEKIDIIPVGINKLKERIKSIRKSYYIVASVGIIDPKIEAPFISLEDLINGSGEKNLMNIIQNNNILITNRGQNIVVKDLCEDSLNRFLTFLNPSKIISVLIRFSSVLEKEMGLHFDNLMRIRLIIHVGCALERMVIKDGLVYKDDVSKLNNKTLKSIKKSADIFRSSLNVVLDDDEIYYIAEMFE